MRCGGGEPLRRGVPATQEVSIRSGPAKQQRDGRGSERPEASCAIEAGVLVVKSLCRRLCRVVVIVPVALSLLNAHQVSNESWPPSDIHDERAYAPYHTHRRPAKSASKAHPTWRSLSGLSLQWSAFRHHCCTWSSTVQHITGICHWSWCPSPVSLQSNASLKSASCSVHHVQSCVGRGCRHCSHFIVILASISLHGEQVRRLSLLANLTLVYDA